VSHAPEGRIAVVRKVGGKLVEVAPRDVVITSRWTAEEKAAVQDAAAWRGLSISDYLRYAHSMAEKDRRKVRTRAKGKRS